MAATQIADRYEVAVNNDQVITLYGLQDVVTGAFINNATMTATLLDERGNPVPNFSGIAMNYVAASNGDYRGLIPAAFNPQTVWPDRSGGYTLRITATASGKQFELNILADVILRRK